MPQSDSSILQGTLDLMVLKTLEHLGPMHGYGIALRIEQIGQCAVIVNQGTIYLCLVRLVQKKWIKAEWGVSDNNRKAKFYSLTKTGRKQLQAETANWERVAGVMGRVLNPQNGNSPCSRVSECSPPASADSSVRETPKPTSTTRWPS